MVRTSLSSWESKFYPQLSCILFLFYPPWCSPYKGIHLHPEVSVMDVRFVAALVEVYTVETIVHALVDVEPTDLK